MLLSDHVKHYWFLLLLNFEYSVTIHTYNWKKYYLNNFGLFEALKTTKICVFSTIVKTYFTVSCIHFFKTKFFWYIKKTTYFIYNTLLIPCVSTIRSNHCCNPPSYADRESHDPGLFHAIPRAQHSVSHSISCPRVWIHVIDLILTTKTTATITTT